MRLVILWLFCQIPLVARASVLPIDLSDLKSPGLAGDLHARRMPERALHLDSVHPRDRRVAFDVEHYGLDLKIDPI